MTVDLEIGSLLVLMLVHIFFFLEIFYSTVEGDNMTLVVYSFFSLLLIFIDILILLQTKKGKKK